MGVHCMAYGCNTNNVSNKNLSFHRFPHKRPEVLKQWVDAIGRVNWQPSEYSRLCSLHFTDDSYAIRPGADKKLLREIAVPSVFNFAVPDIRRRLVNVSTATALATEEQQSLEAMHELTGEQNKVPLQFSKICRLCLVDDEQLYPIFEKKLKSKLQKLSLDVQIEEGDELPQQVCQQCIQHINSSYYFKLQCQRSHTSLMQQLNSQQQKDKVQAQEQNDADNSVQEMEVHPTDNEGEIPPKESEEEQLNDSDVENEQENEPFPSAHNKQQVSTDSKPSVNSLGMFAANYSHFNPKELLRRKLTLLPRVYTCEVCGRSFRTRGTLKQHKKSHLGNKPAHQCDQCNKVYPNQAKLREHMTGVHAEKKPFSCNLCGREFPYKATLKTHIRTHTGEKPFKCDTCGKSFAQKHILEEHRVVHTGERPYICDVCGIGYKQLRNLKSHKETHSGLPKAPKPIKFWCDYCGRGFNAVASFQRHLMTHTGEKPFSCDICDKRFAAKAKMLEHRRTHTNERPFACSECDKTFKIKELLTKHIQMQHNPSSEKHFSCDTCNVSFSNSNFLRKHIRNEHYLGKHYPCPICKSIYVQKHYVKLHIKNVHKVDPETLTIEEKNSQSDSDK